MSELTGVADVSAQRRVIMEKEPEERIRARAFQLWKEAGEPEEGAQDFWLKAEQEHKEREEKESKSEDSQI